MKPIHVIGAGLAGLLAGAMLRTECKAVVEASPALPNNHSAVLRFRSSIVSDVLNIPFRKVNVLRASAVWSNPVADALNYGRKTTGKYCLRSSAKVIGSMAQRWIAPPDLIARMQAMNTNIIYSWMISQKDLQDLTSQGPVISTIPMPHLAQMLGYHMPVSFESVTGTNVIIELRDVDAYASLYVPDPDFPGARISLTGSQAIVECYNLKHDDDTAIRRIAHLALQQLEISESCLLSYRKATQSYGKILPINDYERKKFIMWASENWGIYSLGRYATWRPGLLLDDVVNDVRVIYRLMSGSVSGYEQKKG